MATNDGCCLVGGVFCGFGGLWFLRVDVLKVRGF